MSIRNELWNNFMLKSSVFLHFLFQMQERFFNQNVSDLLQNITSIVSILFIILKSVDMLQKMKHQRKMRKLNTNTPTNARKENQIK